MAELVSLVAQVHELSDFLQWTHIEPVVTHFEPPSLSPWLHVSSAFTNIQNYPLWLSDPHLLKKDSSLESIFFDLEFPYPNIDEIPPRVPLNIQ